MALLISVALSFFLILFFNRVWVAGTLSTVTYAYLLVKICMNGMIAVPEVLDIVSCCSKSGRGVSVDSGDKGTGNSVSRRQVITVDSRPACRNTSRLPQGTSIVALAWFAVEPCPNLACTTRYKRQEEVLQVASRTNPHFGVVFL